MRFDEDEEELKERRAEGYECQRCGYEPTWREARSGVCPQCRPKKAAPKGEDNVPEPGEAAGDQNR